MKNIIKEMLSDVIESKDYDEQAIGRYFSSEYKQVVDQKQLTFDEFKKHIKKLKQLIDRVEVNIINCAVHGHTIFTKHMVHSIFKDGSTHTHKVFAEFTLQDNKIIHCEELTCMIKGSEKAKHLGSIT